MDRDAATVAAEYLDAAAQIEALEQQQATLKDELTVKLSAHTVTGPTVWELGKAKVTWVKGRESSKLDRGKLVRLGVTADVLDKATVTNVGKPGIRIEGASDAERNRASADEIVRPPEAEG